jgi:shikimate dehydrogenase
VRIDEIDGNTTLYVIVGDPISAVRSPAVFNSMFAHRGIDAVMIALHVAAADLAPVWAGMKAMRNLAGVVFTMPHKTAALDLVDAVGPTGALVGAINAARRDPDGTWSGDMFDGRGFVLGLAAQEHVVAGKRAFLIGAGGAGVAIAAALAEADAGAIVIDDADPIRRDDAVSRVRGAFPRSSISAGSANGGDFDFAINATPLGMAPDDALPFDPTKMPLSTVVVDIVNKPVMTPLLVAAEACGHRIHVGPHMHYGQAIGVAQFFGFELPRPDK